MRSNEVGSDVRRELSRVVLASRFEFGVAGTDSGNSTTSNKNLEIESRSVAQYNKRTLALAKSG